MLRWYLVQTKPAAETVAVENLQRQGYEVYFPRALRTARRRGQVRESIVSLFPRYLFVRLDEGRQALTPVRSTTGVACAVRFGFSYAVVPDAVIRELRGREDAVTGLHRIGQCPVFSPGMAVQVKLQPFDGLDAIFEREAGADRVIVLLKVLGQIARVQIPFDSIEAANPAA